MIIGKFIKAKAVKKTDEEVLEGFGAEKQSSDDDSLGQSMRQDGKNKIFYCPVRDIKNRILQSSNSPILESKVLQNAFKIKKTILKVFFKVMNKN